MKSGGLSAAPKGPPRFSTAALPLVENFGSRPDGVIF
jgi:hypothetical protein